MRFKLLIAAAIAVATLAVPSVAFADSCVNVSRAPAPCGMSCSTPVIHGNWVWLPSVGVPFPAWGMAPPGSEQSELNELPGENGNYTNGKTDSLLGVSHNCDPGNPARQETQGIQTGCE